jgi:hypothetical protein
MDPGLQFAAAVVGFCLLCMVGDAGRMHLRFRAWKKTRPVRKFLGHQNVLSQLAVAGVALSAAALLLLIGTSEVQIHFMVASVVGALALRSFVTHSASAVPTSRFVPCQVVDDRNGSPVTASFPR